MIEFSKYDLMSSMASRRKEMDVIDHIVYEMEHKIKKLKEHREELSSLNFLDNILLKELENGTN
jgi:hypothetical protein